MFWGGGSAGQKMALDFCEANEEDGYKYFYSIFSDDFKEAFGGLDDIDYEVATACSQALADFAKGETRVFKDANSWSFQSRSW